MAASRRSDVLIVRAMEGLGVVRDQLAWLLAEDSRGGDHPHANWVDQLEEAFRAIEVDDPGVRPVRRWAFYACLRAGFASSRFAPKLRVKLAPDGSQIGAFLGRTVDRYLAYYDLPAPWVGTLSPDDAVDFATEWIRWRASGLGPPFASGGPGPLAGDARPAAGEPLDPRSDSEPVAAPSAPAATDADPSTGVPPPDPPVLLTCDPKNLRLSACRGAHPSDTEYISTITASGDFPRSIDQLARVYDPRTWDVNPYVKDFFKSVYRSGREGSPEPSPVPSGHSYEGYIREKVFVSGVGNFELTLEMAFARTKRWVAFTYEDPYWISGPHKLQRDFGYVTIWERPGYPGWSHVRVQKNVRFEGIPGSSGGPIGWGNLANLIAPAMVGHWMAAMKDVACWIAPEPA